MQTALVDFSRFRSSEKNASRDGFGTGLVEAGQMDERIVGVSADLAESTRMQEFAKTFPDRFIEVGVAEQNMIGVAAGLALTGQIPFAASYAAFSPYNSFGVIRTAVCYNNANVKIIGGHAGIGIGEDGATHQALEDIALMRTLPNMTVIIPADKEEAHKATKALAIHQGPAYLRTTKFPTLEITTPETPFEVGHALKLTEGSDITIIACGPMVEQALLAAQELQKSQISAMIINMHTIKPLDTAAIQHALLETKALMTVEDHQQAGGLGSAVAEYLSQQTKHLPFAIMGVRDSFGESGTGEQLYHKYGLTHTHVVEQAKQLLKI